MLNISQKNTTLKSSFYRSAFILSLLCTTSGVALADADCLGTNHPGMTATCDYNGSPVRTPTDAIGNTYKTSVSDNANVTMVGNMVFESGLNGFGGNMPISGLGPTAILSMTPQAGLPTDEATLLAMPVMFTDLLTAVVTYTDPDTNEVFTFSVYDNANFIEGRLETQRVETFYGVDQEQYINLRLGEVDTTGGILTVQTEFQNDGGGIGNMYIAAKQSTLFLAEGDGTAISRIIWDVASPTSINMAAAATGEDGELTTTQYVNDWPHDVTVTLNDNSTVVHSITDGASFAAFNTALLDYISTGQIAPVESVYLNYIEQARNLKSVEITYEQQVEDPFPGDKVYIGNGTKAILRAVGAGASVEMAAGTQLNGQAMSGILSAENGANASNDGTLNIYEGTAMRITAPSPGAVRSTGNNSHVINVQYRATGVSVSHSDFSNLIDGIINVEVSDDEYESYGIIASAGSVVDNDGIINVGTNAGGVQNGSSYGAIITDSEFNNNGTIYVGRGAQTSVSDIVADTNVQAADPMAAISVRGDSTITNTGNITIGALSDGVDAFRIIDAPNATVTHSGTIDILGATNRGKLNTGFYIENSGTRTETGGVVTNSITIDENATINLTGTNGTAMYMVADGAGEFSSASMLGNIFIEGTRHPVNRTRNHGLWIEAMNGGENIVDVTGTVTMRGDGAIGILARGNSTVNVVDGGNVIFETGADQVGYFLLGSEATIRVLRNDLSVSTERSTLFRIEAGALFDGRDYHVTASGKDSVGILGVGNGTIVDIENGLYDVTGDGATAVRITGGAQGWVYNDATINLNANNTRGIIADGNEYNILGDLVTANNTNTIAHSTTNVNAQGDDVVGFTVMNSATLNYQSSDLMFPSPISSVTSSSGRLFSQFMGANSVAFKGENTSNFNINNADVVVNGWVFNTNNGLHTLDLKNMTGVGSAGFLQNVTDTGEPASTANVTMQNVQAQGIITTDSASTTNLTMDAASRWLGAGGSTLTDLENDGYIALATQTWDGVFRTLEVTGDYTGTPGSIIAMHVKLDDGLYPQTDKLIFENTYGETTLFIKNGGGYGGQTTGDGIEIIEVAGISDGVFALGQRLFAGAYEYELFKSSLLAPNGNWYLRSTGFRPEVPIYSAANDFMARFGRDMMGTYRDRYGRTDNAAHLQRGWGRTFGSFGDARQKRVDPIVDTQKFFKHGTSYDYNIGGVQTGMDLLRRGGDGVAQDSAGFYIGAGHGVANVNHVFNGRAGKLRQNSYSLGAYWTRQSEQDDWYLDALVQATYYDLNSTTFLGMTDKTHGMGYAASLEAGYNIPLTTSKSWSIEPQAQILYQYTNIKNITDYAGIIRFNDTNNLYGRLGARLVHTHQMPDSQPIKAWLRADVWQDLTHKTYTDFLGLDGTESARIKNKPLGTWGQVGLGMSGHVTNNVSLFASGDYMHNISHENERGWNGRVGLSVQW